MDIVTLQAYETAFQKATQWVGATLKDEGSLGENCQDVLAYYKVPYLFSLSGLQEPAHRVLNFMSSNFFQVEKSGQAHVGAQNVLKGLKDEGIHALAWIIIGAHRLGRFDLSYPLSQDLRGYYDPSQGAFTNCAPCGQAEAVLDVLSSALLGWMYLFLGDLNKAKRAGNFLQRALSLQTSLPTPFYLRMDDKGRFISNFDPQQAAHFVIQSHHQSPFVYKHLSLMVGVLVNIFWVTQEESYLRSAKAYQEVAQTVPENGMCGQLAWGPAVLAKVTQEQRFIDQCTQIMDAVLAQQEQDGRWGDPQGHTQTFERTTENAIWCQEVLCELSQI